MVVGMQANDVRNLFLLLLTCCTCFGQSLIVGVAGGGRPTDDVTSSATPESRRYVIGPTIELGLPLGLAVEVDALYHRHGYLTGFANPSGSGTESERANDWEFPVLLKYRLGTPLIKPFFEAGVAPRRISGTVAESGNSVNIPTGQITPLSSRTNTNWSSSVGVVLGGGVRLGFGRLQLSPEIRYTHWTSTPINVSFGDGPSFQSTQEQVDILVGIGWKLR
jgi:hypothetical protein